MDQIRKSIAAAAGVKPEDVRLEHPERPDYGDFSSNIAMTTFSKPKKDSKYNNPIEYATIIAEKLTDDELIEKAAVAGPGFVNIWIKNECLVREVERVISLGQTYGKGNWGQGQRWLLEHTSPNPNKAMHLGHLRNNVTAMAIANIWEYSGLEVIKDAIDNDRGIAIAKLMYGYLLFAKKDEAEPTLDFWFENRHLWFTPEEKGMRPDRFVDELYIKGAAEYETEPAKSKIKQLVIDWETNEIKVMALWETVMAYAHAGQKMTLDRLGSRWDWVWHEHEHYKQGKEIVEAGLKKGVFKEGENGAVVTNLESYKLPDTVVIKSDGTALYLTQDLALTKLKQDKFHPQKMFWTIGPEQTLALQQLYAICEQLGYGKREDYTHLSYGYMSIKGGGKMSSRAGNVVLVDDLLDLAKNSILQVLSDRNLAESDKQNIAEKVGVGAVKYSILKVGRLQDTAFDIKDSVSMEGNSGPYIQYTFARTQSVLRKSQIPGDNFQKISNNQFLNYKMNSEEVAIARWIYRFPEVIEEAARRYSPNLVANFIYELAQKYNGFYNKHSILEAGTEEQKDFRLLLTRATGEIIKKGLNLLGLEVLESM